MGAQPKSPPDRSPIAARVKERIAREGPLSVHDYMQICTTGEHGYYATHQPVGSEGDFITAPEVSQIFGELIGAWVVAVWQSLGEPSSLIIAELGPGRGTLISDALRVFKNVPKLIDSASVALIETSPPLRATQEERLRGSPLSLHWYDSLDVLPARALIVIANEFIDALPVQQFVFHGGQWRERAVRLGRSGNLEFCAGAPKASALPASLCGEEVEGALFETRPAASALVATLAARAKQAPVAALIADYGHEVSGFGDTLQAVHRHRFADPLAMPGEADLTAHVDFAALKETAASQGLAVFGPMPQGQFLLKLGLAARCERLMQSAGPEQRAEILSAAARLADPRQMGLLFKVLVLQSAGLAPPPPFGEIQSATSAARHGDARQDETERFEPRRH